jgi:hypothetical protein
MDIGQRHALIDSKRGYCADTHLSRRPRDSVVLRARDDGPPVLHSTRRFQQTADEKARISASA